MKVRAAGPLLLVALAAGACATKKDVDNLSAELTAVRVRQDSVWATVAALEESVSRALENQGALVMTVRGDLLRQMDDMERQLVEIQELLGQSQVVLQSLRGRMEQRQADREFLPGPADSVGFADDTAREGASGNAGALYAAAIDQFRRGAYGTARSGFEEYLVSYPAGELAPDAQYYLAETYREEGTLELAIREYNRVVELYPNSGVAPRALYKAGLLQEERGNLDSACQKFQSILAGYPRSDESRLARDQAERLNCR